MALPIGTRLSDLNQAQVLEFQQLLLRAGFNPGPLDGILGNQTIQAYSRFLVAQGGQLGPTQVVDDLTSTLSGSNDPSVWQGVNFGSEVPVASESVSAPPPPSQGTTTSTTTSSSAPPPTMNPTDGTVEQQIRERFPDLYYLIGIPEVREILAQATVNGWNEAQLRGALYPTSWWQTTNAAMRVWDGKMANDPATANAEWDQKALTVLHQASLMGAPVDQAGAKWLAGKVLREGWSDNQLKKFLADTVRQNGAGPGSVTANQANIRETARQYLVSMDDRTALEWAARIEDGSGSIDAVESMLRDQAKARFHWLAPQIESGLTPTQLFDANRRAVADLLEIDTEHIDLNNPKWSALTSPVQDTQGLRAMNFYEAQNWARSQADWRFTNNARTKANELGLSLLRAMGFVAPGSSQMAGV